jgi:starvation-inducible DNA-binding protein
MTMISQDATAGSAGGGTRAVPQAGRAPAGDGVAAAGGRGGPFHAIGTVRPVPLALGEEPRRASVGLLNQLLADTITLRDLYKKHHWQTAGPTFYQLHLLFDKHYVEQAKLVDEIAERIRILGGVSVAMAHDVAEMTQVPRPPIGREPPPAQIARLLQAHEVILLAARSSAHEAAANGDDGTNDLIVSSVIRTNEMQVWFVGEHLEDVPLLGDRPVGR